MKVNINTKIMEDGKILQEVAYDSPFDLHNIGRRILDTQEEQTRAALIRLGWTPPKKEIEQMKTLALEDREGACVATWDAAELMKEACSVRIMGADLVLTCDSCPEQYDVFVDGKQIGYLRLRFGNFRAHYKEAGGEVIYYYDACSCGRREKYKDVPIDTVDVKQLCYCGSFKNGATRFMELKNAVQALLDHWKRKGCE